MANVQRLVQINKFKSNNQSPGKCGSLQSMLRVAGSMMAQYKIQISALM
jgi:hypothetical protein